MQSLSPGASAKSDGKVLDDAHDPPQPRAGHPTPARNGPQFVVPRLRQADDPEPVPVGKGGEAAARQQGIANALGNRSRSLADLVPFGNIFELYSHSDELTCSAGACA